MKRVLSAIGLIVVTLTFVSCQSARIESFARFTLSNESVRLVHGDANLPPISVMVSYVNTDEKNNESIVILADGELVDGELLLNGRVDEPKEILITVNVGNDEVGRALSSVLKPNGNVEFVLRYTSPISYGMHLVGNDHQSIDENRGFSLSGNIRSLDGFERYVLNQDPIYVALRPMRSILDSDGESFYVSSVLLDGGEFSIERDIDKPTPVRIEIYVRSSGLRQQVEHLHAILEPGVNYRVVPLGNNGKFAVQADRDSIHSRLVSSWQFDPAFIALIDQWIDERAKRPTSIQAQAEHKEKFVENYQIADECDHLNLTDNVKLKFFRPYPTAYETTGNEIVKRRSDSLRKILRDTQDPELAKMVFDLSWTLFYDDEIDSEDETDEKIATLLEFSRNLDQELVETVITPTIDDIKRHRELARSNESLLPGQVAPAISLTTLSGDDVSLSKVLSENKLVLIDFWASWCGPCIESFPKLKRLYSKNKDLGFEIVTISVDDSLEDWETASETHKLPWIDIGDLEDGEMTGWDVAPTAMDYGVIWIPNQFLIDTHGCIVHKHFTDADLKKMLSSLNTGSS